MKTVMFVYLDFSSLIPSLHPHEMIQTREKVYAKRRGSWGHLMSEN